MTFPKVQTQALNKSQGSSPEIERRSLFIGVADGSSVNTLVPISSSSDFDDLMGAGDSVLKSNVEAFALSAGPGFTAAYIEIENFADWPAALEIALDQFTPEMVGVCMPVSSQQDLSDAQTTALEQLTKLEMPVTIFIGTPAITGVQSWTEYLPAQNALTDGLDLDRVVPVPDLNGNNIGALIGRLAKPHLTVADSPCRVETGADNALGPFKVDKDGKAITLAVLEALHNNSRLTVPMWYTNVEGIYWTDCVTLNKTTGDFVLIENRRVIDKAHRLIRPMTINLIGNRAFNATETSIEFYKSFLAGPLRLMARADEIQEPDSEAIQIEWIDRFKVKIFYKVTPFNSPKEIINNLFLDLSI